MRATLAVRIVATGVVSVAVATGSGSSAAAMPTEAPRTVITVDFGSPAGRLPADFVGLSFEIRELGIGNLDPDRGNLVPLFRTLGRSNLRIAGNTLDRDTLWAPPGQPVPDALPAWRASDVRAGLKMIMIHKYSMDETGTAARLLSPDQNPAQRQAVTPNLAAATAAGLPLRVDETNSAWGGGINGVSNTNASALW